MKGTIIGIAAAFATTIAFLVILEAARRRGMDPVARIADVIAPMSPRSDASANGSSAGTAASAATAQA